MASAACRIANISACAVGSRSVSVRLPAVAMTSKPRTITHPIGTSPAFPAFSAVFSAKSMKEGAVMPRIIRRNLLLDAPSAKVDADFA
jgi:hypothetical protein